MPSAPVGVAGQALPIVVLAARPPSPRASRATGLRSRGDLEPANVDRGRRIEIDRARDIEHREVARAGVRGDDLAATAIRGDRDRLLSDEIAFFPGVSGAASSTEMSPPANEVDGLVANCASATVPGAVWRMNANQLTLPSETPPCCVRSSCPAGTGAGSAVSWITGANLAGGRRHRREHDLVVDRRHRLIRAIVGDQAQPAHARERDAGGAIEVELADGGRRRGVAAAEHDQRQSE
jgi:hypothetical protein